MGRNSKGFRNKIHVNLCKSGNFETQFRFLGELSLIIVRTFFLNEIRITNNIK